MKLHVQRRSVEESFLRTLNSLLHYLLLLMMMRVPCCPLLTWMPQERSLNGATKVKFDEESLSRNDAM